MSPGFSPLLHSETRAQPSSPRGLVHTSVASSTGDQTTAGYTSRSSTYPMPVVREMPPRQPSFEATW